MTVVLVSYSRNKATLRPYASIDSTVAKALRPAPPRQYDSSDTPASSKTITAGTTQATLDAGEHAAHPIQRLLIPRPLFIDTKLYGAPERHEVHSLRFGQERARQRRLQFLQAPARFAASGAGRHVDAQRFAFGSAQLAVEPAFNRRDLIFTAVHKNVLNLSCSFFLA